MIERVDSIAVPPPARAVFHGGIDHPGLLLWDAWTYEADGVVTLFTLAVARHDGSGRPVTAGTRDDYPFHVRRFASDDHGETWRDRGAYLRPSTDTASAHAHNVWSGSALAVGGRLIFGFTGVRAPAPDRPHVQSICLVEADLDGTPPDARRTVVLSDPERDYDAIRRAGYYLGPKHGLGGPGEEDGPILAWRDPFFVAEPDGGILAYWSAKVAPRRPAVAHAPLVATAEGYALGPLRPPIELPDAEEYTQAEVPKVYADPGGDGFLMLVSTCDRISEDQPSAAVTKALRLYRAPAPGGPWSPYKLGGSLLAGAGGLFGGLLTDLAPGRATLISPFSEMAPEGSRLTVAAPRRIDLA